MILENGDMWNDISEDKLAEYRKEWGLSLKDRYTIQLLTLDNMPAVDCEVKLLDENQKEVWAGKTDNTGKAELWANIAGVAFTGEVDYSIEVKYKDKTQKIENVKKFHDGINIFGIEDYCNKPNNVDIAFVVDATGSMGDEINYLKAELNDIINKIKNKYKDIKVNLGSVFYRDVNDDYLAKKSDLSPDISKTIDFINQQHAGGGGDFPEAVELALQTAINEFSWSDKAITRLLFLILDAPPHNTPIIKEKLQELLAKASMNGIRIIPVTCSGIDKSTEYIMRSFALATNGTYTFLTNHSGVGDKHIEPTTDKYDVELLNSLFIRLIDQFTAMPLCSQEDPLAKADIKNNILNQDEPKLDENSADAVKCYPNPTNGDLTIELSSSIEELYLTDIAGKILQRFEKLDKGKHPIDLSQYPTGIFFIKYMLNKKWGQQQSYAGEMMAI